MRREKEETIFREKEERFKRQAREAGILREEEGSGGKGSCGGGGGHTGEQESSAAQGSSGVHAPVSERWRVEQRRRGVRVVSEIWGGFFCKNAMEITFSGRGEYYITRFGCLWALLYTFISSLGLTY